jgi:hypothetical protein
MDSHALFRERLLWIKSGRLGRFFCGLPDSACAPHRGQIDDAPQEQVGDPLDKIRWGRRAIFGFRDGDVRQKRGS